MIEIARKHFFKSYFPVHPFQTKMMGKNSQEGGFSFYNSFNFFLNKGCLIIRIRQKSKGNYPPLSIDYLNLLECEWLTCFSYQNLFCFCGDFLSVKQIKDLKIDNWKKYPAELIIISENFCVAH